VLPLTRVAQLAGELRPSSNRTAKEEILLRRLLGALGMVLEAAQQLLPRRRLLEERHQLLKLRLLFGRWLTSLEAGEEEPAGAWISSRPSWGRRERDRLTKRF
jgi:hypothetical protein